MKSLAAEARIIRFEEERARKHLSHAPEEHRPKHQHTVDILKAHRAGIVRRAMRETLLAYGFLRGRARAAIEPTNKPNNKPDWGAVEKMVVRYGTGDSRVLKQNLAQWIAA